MKPSPHCRPIKLAVNSFFNGGVKDGHRGNMRTATIEQFWNNQEDRLGGKTPRCVVTLTERNKVKRWELDLENPAHCDVEHWLGFGNNYTCPYADGDEPFADGRPFKITYTTRRKSSIDLLVKVGEPISTQTVPRKTEYKHWCGQSIRMEVLISLSKKPMAPNEVACDVWLRLEEASDANPFTTSEYIPIRATLNRLFKEGSVVRLRRGVYALSEDSRYELFRDAMMALCENEPVDTASVTAAS